MNLTQKTTNKYLGDPDPDVVAERRNSILT